MNINNKRRAGLALICALLFCSNSALAERIVKHIEETEAVSQAIVDGADANDTWVSATDTLQTTGTVLIEPAHDTIEFRAPKVVLKVGFHAKSGSSFSAGVPTFKIHCLNIVNPLDVAGNVGGQDNDPNNVFATMTSPKFVEICKNEIKILNYYFANEKDRQIVKFTLGQAVEWHAEMVDTIFYKCKTDSNDDCPASSGGRLLSHEEAYMISEADCAQGWGAGCSMDAYRNTDMINMRFFRRHGSNNANSNANMNIGTSVPAINLHYTRLDENLDHDCDGDGIIDDCGLDSGGDVILPQENNGIQDDDHNRGGVEAHEMGHSFGLQHVFDQAATANSRFDNVMASGGIDNNNNYYPYWVDVEVHHWSEHCGGVGQPACQVNSSNRNGGFLFDPFGDDSNVVGGITYYKFQRYNYGNGTCQDDDYWAHGQAEIVMSFAEFYKKELNLE